MSLPLIKKAKRHLRLLLAGDQSKMTQRKRSKHWFRIYGDETLRLNYPLNKESLVFDVGTYKGDWAESISKLYGSEIYCFEPVTSFSENLNKRFKDHPEIKIHNFSLGGKTEKLMISHSADGSSVHKGDAKEEIQIIDIYTFLEEHKLQNIDLLKLNIEGSEYDLLERLIEKDLLHRIDSLQVQFHNFFPDAKERMLKIRKALSRTHITTYQYDFIWENWKRKTV